MGDVIQLNDANRSVWWRSREPARAVPRNTRQDDHVKRLLWLSIAMLEHRVVSLTRIIEMTSGEVRSKLVHEQQILLVKAADAKMLAEDIRTEKACV